MSHAVATLAATILDHPWILLIAVAIGLVRWLSSKAQSSKDISQPPDAPTISRREAQTEEERVRRFLEALGQPPGARPPPAVARRTIPRETIQRFPSPIRSPLPPLKTVPPPLPAALESRAKPTPRAAKATTETEPIFEIKSQGDTEDPFAVRRAEVSPAGPSSFAARLAKKQGLRDAIVLREIFGPPRSLQSPDPVSGF